MNAVSKNKITLVKFVYVLLGSLLMANYNAFADSTEPSSYVPSLFWSFPFVLILLAIAVFPLIPKLSHWWEHNLSKLYFSLILAIIVSVYYFFRTHGMDGHAAGWPTVSTMLHHSVVADFVPFIILLLSLYVISGGIRLTGDIPAHPLTNTCFLLIGAVLASFIGTTGASMLLIRPVLQINRERKHVKHTIIFFIFLVSNIGGSLLPVGDPPLFLGYLRGVPFFWTLSLFLPWLFVTGILLVIYFITDCIAYRHEDKASIALDETQRTPLRLHGQANFLLLAGVIVAVAALVPGRVFPGTSWIIPDCHLREIILLSLSALSFVCTPREIHARNHFNFHAIAEVACLFIGIFITMQVPIEILKDAGASLGVTTPLQFFWLTGMLSSFLDNAPTYAVFFELAGTTQDTSMPLLHNVSTMTGSIPIKELLAISCGSVFMGANTYIGNGPNFLVKSIAEHHGVKMPGFFGYMLYSGLILIPVFLLVSYFFFM